MAQKEFTQKEFTTKILGKKVSAYPNINSIIRGATHAGKKLAKQMSKAMTGTECSWTIWADGTVEERWRAWTTFRKEWKEKENHQKFRKAAKAVLDA